MDSSIIASLPGWLAGIYIWIVAGLVFIVLPALIIVYLLGLSKRLRNTGREWKLLRMDLSKLSEEVHLLRQELKNVSNKDNS